MTGEVVSGADAHAGKGTGSVPDTSLPRARYREVTPALFDAEQFESWWNEWRGMPEYSHELATPFYTVIVHFRNRADLSDFARRLEQSIPGRGKKASIWHPERVREARPRLRYRSYES